MKNFKVFFVLFTLFFLLVMSQSVKAQIDMPQVGDIYQNFYVDLNGDGIEEEVQIKVFSSYDYNWFGQLVILDSKGTLIWKGPQDTDLSNPLIFGATDFGVSLPELVGDIDNDGYVEILKPGPISDVQAPPFIMLRSKGKSFSYVKEGYLIEKPEGSGKFPWSVSSDHRGMGTWVSEFQTISEEGAIVKIFSVSMDDFMTGRALLKSDSKGFYISDWITPLQSAY